MTDTVRYDDNILAYVPPISSLVVEDFAIGILGNSEKDYAFSDARNVLVECIFTERSQIETISKYSFYQCKLLKTIDLSVCHKLHTISDYAFYSCSSLTTILFPTSLTTLEKFCFSYTQLIKIDLPSNVKQIGSECFSNTPIEEFCIPEDSKLESIADHILATAKITSFYIPQYLKAFPGDTFSLSSAIINITIHLQNTALSVIDNVVLNKEKTKIIYCASGKKGTYQIPSQVTEIGYTAFIKSSLTQIIFHNNITYIGFWCFCRSELVNATLQSSCLNILASTFRLCQSLKTIIIPEGVVQIGQDAFRDCSALEKIIFPSSLKQIDGGVFIGCPDT